jgi:hypothetical protein
MGGSLGENENRPGAMAMEQEKEAAVAWEPWMEEDETKLSDEKRQVGLAAPRRCCRRRRMC